MRHKPSKHLPTAVSPGRKEANVLSILRKDVIFADDEGTQSGRIAQSAAERGPHGSRLNLEPGDVAVKRQMDGVSRVFPQNIAADAGNAQRPVPVPGSEQCPKLVRAHADVGQDAAQGSPGEISRAVDRHRRTASIRVPHDVVATCHADFGKTGTLEGPDNLRSRYDRDVARHKAGSYQKSGYVECQSHLFRYAELFDQRHQSGTKVGERLFLRVAVAIGAHPGPDAGRGAPDAVLILLHDVGHVYVSSHTFIMHEYTWWEMYPPRTHCHEGRLGTS